MSKVFLYCSSSTDAGIAKKINQDNILVRTAQNRHSSYGIFAVADGMGGLSHGEVASRIACDFLNSWWEEEIPHLLNNDKIHFEDLEISLEKLFNKINGEIFKFASQAGENAGTTLSVLFIYNSYYIIKHIGDSRIYRIGKEVEQLTYDHTWVSFQVSSGNLTYDEARVHPKRNVLTQCLGVFSELDIFTKRGVIENDDVFIICSDGFYDKLDDNDFRKGAMLIRENTLYGDEIAKDLISLCKGKRREG